MKLIAGLGNPGAKYRNTRHNIGFEVLDCLAGRLGVRLDREKYGGLMVEARIDGEKVLLLKPLTFMNLSGDSVARAARNNTQDPQDVVVVVDDVNLPLGRLRLRKGGSAGGHNGLKSVIERLGTDQFPRLRIGVGEEQGGRALRDHVLGKFRPDEKLVVNEAIERGAEAVEQILRAGIDNAMNEYNRAAAQRDDRDAG